MKVSRAQDEGGDEEKTNPRVESETDRPPHQGLTECTNGCEDITNKVKLGNLSLSSASGHQKRKRTPTHLVGVRQEAPDISHDGMEANI